MEERIERIRRRIAAKQLRLRDPILLADVEGFEKRHGVRLPEEYRRFIVAVGNGGAGPPFYGMLGLDHVAGDYAKLGKPFPFDEIWIADNEPEKAPELFERAEHGTLRLGTDGCGMEWLLIVTGPQRGQIWQLAEPGVCPCDPPLDFLSWYERWLDGRTEWWSGRDA